MATETHRASSGALTRGEELSLLRRAHAEGARLLCIEAPPGAGARALLDAWLKEIGPTIRVAAGTHTIERLVDAALAQLSPVRRARHPAQRLRVEAATARPAAVVDLMAATERRLRLREETAHLCAELGAVVVIEGIDRTERSAVDLLASLSAKATCVVVADAPHPLARDPRARVITLRPLDRERVRALLASPEIVDAVLARTSGLPELIERLVHGDPVPQTSIAPPPSALDATRALASAGDHERAAALAIETADELAARHREVDAADLLLEASTFLTARPLSMRLAELLWIAGDHAKAVATAERLAAGSHDEQVLVMLGRLLALEGRHARAIEVLRGVEGDDARVVLAEAHYGVGAYEAARAIAEPALTSADLRVALDAENTIAKVELASAQYEAAERRLSAALARSSELPRHACQALNNLGILALGRGELAAATARFHEMIELGAEHGVVYYRGVAHKNLAVALQLEGRYDEALDHAERALGMLAGIADRSLLARVAFNTADLHVVLGDPYRALRTIAHARDRGELSPAVEREGLRVEAAAHAELGNKREARLHYERAIELGDTSAEVWLGLASLAADAADMTRAAELLERAEVVDRRSAARAALVRARICAGDISLARLAVERADATNDPLMGQAPRLELARALESAGLADRAREELASLRAREAQLIERVPVRLRALFAERPLARKIASLERSLGQPRDGMSLGALTYEEVRRGDSLYTMRKRIERECIERALTESDGNISRAAELLGMKRPRLSKLVSAFGLKRG
jgi:tetratricopeptide (TPR) repeat protein